MSFEVNSKVLIGSRIETIIGKNHGWYEVTGFTKKLRARDLKQAPEPKISSRSPRSSPGPKRSDLYTQIMNTPYISDKIRSYVPDFLEFLNCAQGNVEIKKIPKIIERGTVSSYYFDVHRDTTPLFKKEFSLLMNKIFDKLNSFENKSQIQDFLQENMADSVYKKINRNHKSTQIIYYKPIFEINDKMKYIYHILDHISYVIVSSWFTEIGISPIKSIINKEMYNKLFDL